MKTNQQTVSKVFTVYKGRNTLEVSVYGSLDDLTSRIEWQDMLGGYFTILDSLGNVYQWDDSKTEEFATVYNYTLISYRTDFELSCVCLKNYELSNFADEFEVVCHVLK